MSPCGWCPAPHVAPAAAGDAARVSVVVCHYEQQAALDRTLAALARQTLPPHEVVVTDDGSAVPPRVAPGVRVVRQPDKGFRAARARNRGAAVATGELLVFLDADSTPEPGLLGHLVARLRAEPDLLVVGTRRHTTFGPPDADDPLRGAAEHALEDPAWLERGWRDTDDLAAADDASFRFVISAVMACDARWFSRVGGLDETFVGYGGEDWDLAHRWWRSGGRLHHARDAVAWHDGDHAGGPSRAEDDTGSRRTREAVAVGRRVDASPVGFRGLRAAAPPLVVTHEADLTERELLLAVDGLLAGVPRAVVRSDHPVWRELRDPRVLPVADTGDPRVARASAGATAARALHLRAGVVAEPAAWAALAAHPLDVTHLDLGAALTLTDLRRLRRAHLGLEPVVRRTTALPDGVRSADGVALSAWLGGWW